MSERHSASRSSPSFCPHAPCYSTPSTIKIYQAVMIGLPLLFTVILLVLLICSFYLIRRRNAQASSRLRAQLFARSRLNASAANNSLCKIFRDSLPVTMFDDKFSGFNEDIKCPVCLNDFVLNEKLRKLPVCGHCFHLDCIDEWIQSNSTCPVCRSTLIVTRKVVPLKVPVRPAAVGSSQSTGAQNSSLVESAEASEAPQSRTIGISDANTAPPEVADGLSNV
ncbi:hypothetical protein O6H91_07G087500 [Diphasiastrum complanatum]|uniref:Uncharacterized protein n=1 Tax=Diphasiastrum complanatum TaxID=34168 RepID=A0ACC2D7N6_DIPCM|nr:hypothetical protein O6H91_07G087500 [Diphasiastrum complanatum]